MSKLIRPKRLMFEQEMGQSAKPQIKPLLFEKVAQKTNLKIDVIKYKFYKHYSESYVQ